MKTIRQEFIEAAAKSSSMACTQVVVRKTKRSQKQVKSDAKWARDSIAKGMKLQDAAKMIGVCSNTLCSQIQQYQKTTTRKIQKEGEPKRKPRIVYAKPTFWQKCKRIISNIWG